MVISQKSIKQTARKSLGVGYKLKQSILKGAWFRQLVTTIIFSYWFVFRIVLLKSINIIQTSKVDEHAFMRMVPASRFLRQWTLLVITLNNCKHKNLLCNGEHCWAFDSIKHCDKRLPLKWCSFRERSNFTRIWFRDIGFIIWGLEIKHLKAHNFVWQGCFFFHSYLLTSTTNWAQIFTGLLFYACWDTSSEKTGLWNANSVQCLEVNSK